MVFGLRNPTNFILFSVRFVQVEFFKTTGFTHSQDIMALLKKKKFFYTMCLSTIVHKYTYLGNVRESTRNKFSRGRRFKEK